MKYRFVQVHANHYPVNLLCQMLNVKRSTYYDWGARPTKVMGQEELALRQRMQSLFIASRESLGSRTLLENLHAEGFD